MIEEFKIGDIVVVTGTNIDDDPYYVEKVRIGVIKSIDKKYPFPYCVEPYRLPDDFFGGVWSTVRALTLLERELEDV